MPAPKTNIKERDLSTRVPSFPGATGALVVDALKGDVDTPVNVGSDTTFLKKYTISGDSISVGESSAHWSAIAFYQGSDDLVVVRAAPLDVDYGGLTLQGNAQAGDNASAIAGINNPEAYTFDTGEAVLIHGANQGAWNNSIGVKIFPYRANVNEAFGTADVDDTVNDTIDLDDGLAVDEWETGEAIIFSVADESADVLPAPLVAGTTYYAIVDGTGNTIKVATSVANALADTAIDLTDTGTGTGEVFTVSLATEKAKEVDSFLIEVYKKDSDGNWVWQEEKLCSLTEGAKDGFNNNMYVEEALLTTDNIRGVQNVAVSDSNVKAQFMVLTLAQGDDGSPITDADFMRAAAKLINPNNVRVTLLMDGGRANATYGTYLNSIAQARKDSVAILSVPYAVESTTNAANNVVNYRKNILNLNSSYSSLYTSHVKIYDKFNDRPIFVSPDGFVAAAISRTAADYDIWYPTGGFRRGDIKRFNVLDVRNRYEEADEDLLYDNGINPIQFASGKGIFINGNKTLLARPSDLQSLNVRLLLVVIEPAIKEALDDFLFELNDATTRGIIRSRINAYLNNILSRRGITDFRVVCDDTNNTAEDISNNRLNVWVFIKPTKPIEEINFTTVITSAGMEFSLAEQSL